MSKIKSYLNDKTCLIYDFGLCLENGLYYDYAIPGFSSICSVIGWGNTIDDVINQVKDCLDNVSAFELQKILAVL